MGIRAEEGEPGMKRSNMGRETYLLPVTWEREPMEWHSLGPSGKRLWPVCAPETGKVERCLALPMGVEQTEAHNEFYETGPRQSIFFDVSFFHFFIQVDKIYHYFISLCQNTMKKRFLFASASPPKKKNLRIASRRPLWIWNGSSGAFRVRALTSCRPRSCV